MRRLALIVVAVILSGCTQATSLVTRPPEGYQALRFKETVQFAGPLNTGWEFPAGALMVQDRTRAPDGAALWCGPMISRVLGGQIDRGCITLQGRTAGITDGTNATVTSRELPAGSFELTRL